MTSFFTYWWYGNTSSNNNAVPVLPPGPVPTLMPGPARNLPLSTTVKQVAASNSKALIVSQQMIHSIQLRKVNPIIRRKKFEPRHPVLQELIATSYRKKMCPSICNALKLFWELDQIVKSAAVAEKVDSNNIKKEKIDCGNGIYFYLWSSSLSPIQFNPKEKKNSFEK